MGADTGRDGSEAGGVGTGSGPRAGGSGVHVIAEAGANHGGDLALGKRYVGLARASGSDSLKFQIIDPPGLFLDRLYKGDGAYEPNEPFKIRSAMAMPESEWRELAAYSVGEGVPFSASVFDEAGVRLLDDLDAPYIKIASCDLNHSELLRAAAGTGRRLIVSTGFSTLGQIERAVSDLVSGPHGEIVLMHCVSRYPAPTGAMNLSMIDTLRSAFGFPVGLSDHTESSVSAVIAVAKGATWIEKHVTHDRGTEGYDHAYAMEEDMMTGYVRDIRDAEAALRPNPLKLSEPERERSKIARRSVYAARDIRPGETIRAEDLRVVRPAGILEPNDAGLIVGRIASKAIAECEPLDWDKVG